MKSIKLKLGETDKDRVAVFEKAASGFAKKIVANFGDYEFVCYFQISTRYTNIINRDLVHWRIHEPGWHDCSTELSGKLHESWYILQLTTYVLIRRTALLVSSQIPRMPGRCLRYITAYFTFWKDGLKEEKI